MGDDLEPNSVRPNSMHSATKGRSRPSFRQRRIAFALLAVFLAFFLSLACTESVFRLFVQVTDVPFMFWDPVLGLRREPNQAGRYISGAVINARFNINKQGWNYPFDFTPDKPEGSFRVCLIGDSQVESIHVDVDKTAPIIAQQYMTEKGVPAQWYPFGCSGYGTNQHLEIIRHYALDYEPDLVLLLYVGNDPFDCSPYLSPLEPWQPIYYLNENGRLVHRSPELWRPSALRRFSAQFEVVRYFMIQKRLLGRLAHGRGPGRAAMGPPEQPVRERTTASRQNFIPDIDHLAKDQRQQRTWRLTKELLRAARDACAGRGARFGIAYRGWSPEIDAPVEGEEPPSPPRAADPYCLGERMREMGREQVSRLARELDIPYIDLTQALQAAVRQSGRSHRFPDDNHFNEMAHQAAGRAIAKFAIRMLADAEDLEKNRAAPRNEK